MPPSKSLNILSSPILPATHATICQVADDLCNGKLIGLPTETVYGLACDASNPKALANLFVLKNRPRSHPVIVHLQSADSVDDWAIDIPDCARTLMQTFWPGPLTLVLKRALHVSDAVTGGQETVALRVSAHDVLFNVLKALQQIKNNRQTTQVSDPANQKACTAGFLPIDVLSVGIAAPSANRFGRISPTRAGHVKDEFPEGLAAILDGGPCAVGIESTIVGFSHGNQPVILRPGIITEDSIQAALALDFCQKKGKPENNEALTVRVSGQLSSHYAPNAAAFLIEKNELPQLIQKAVSASKKVGVLAFSVKAKMDNEKERIATNQLVWHAMPLDPLAYATQLYATLRQLDTLNCEVIFIENPTDCLASLEKPQWAGIFDRLKRATAKSKSDDFL
ncbi:MAG: L-threonylcarbamoyladenylate synthase [Cyanobacteria bacterium P01_H01_bin.74]